MSLSTGKEMRYMATKSKNIKKPAGPQKPAGETIEQLIRRIEQDLLWVIISALVSMGLGLFAGQLIKF
jgi:hypothetical protein